MAVWTEEASLANGGIDLSLTHHPVCSQWFSKSAFGKIGAVSRDSWKRRKRHGQLPDVRGGGGTRKGLLMGLDGPCGRVSTLRYRRHAHLSSMGSLLVG